MIVMLGICKTLSEHMRKHKMSYSMLL